LDKKTRNDYGRLGHKGRNCEDIQRFGDAIHVKIESGPSAPDLPRWLRECRRVSERVVAEESIDSEAAHALETWQSAVELANEFLESPDRKTLPPGKIMARSDRVPFPQANITSVLEQKCLRDTAQFDYGISRVANTIVSCSPQVALHTGGASQIASGTPPATDTFFNMPSA